MSEVKPGYYLATWKGSDGAFPIEVFVPDVGSKPRVWTLARSQSWALDYFHLISPIQMSEKE